MGNPRMLVAYTLGVALVVGAIISLTTNSWWFLILALGAHFAASVFFLLYTFKRIDQADKPDAVTEARLEAEAEGEGKNGDGTGLTKSGRRDDREIVN